MRGTCHKFDHPQLTDNFVIDGVFEREEERKGKTL